MAWDFHTYLLEKFQYSPVMYFFAIQERGKSRTGIGMLHVAYRGIHDATLREAHIIRTADRLKGTIFFDIKDIWNTSKKGGSEDVLLNRYEKGAKVYRVLSPDKGPFEDEVSFNVYGATIIATNKCADEILESRALLITMPESNKRYNKRTKEEALPLKERLTAFRAFHLEKVLPEIEEPTYRRLGDIMKPLLQMTELVKPSRTENLIALTQELEEKKKSELFDSQEESLVKVIIRARPLVKYGHLSVEIITNLYNSSRSEKYKISSKSIGKILSSLGFAKKRIGSQPKTSIFYDETLINNLKARYGLENCAESADNAESVDTVTN